MMDAKSKKVMSVIFASERKLSDYDLERMAFPNFFEWSKASGRGKDYRVTQLKLRIAYRILNQTGESQN